MLSKVLKTTAQRRLANTSTRAFASGDAKRVCVTGGCGAISYSILFRIASGEFLGKDQKVILHLLDLPHMEQAMEGVKAELHDCAFPLLEDVVCTSNLSTAFKDVDYNFLVGAKPRGPGMERSDLLKDNGKIFIDTGKAINDHASRDVKTIVVGNPANTNCLICMTHAPDIPQGNFTAMTRLDHNRAAIQIALKTGTAITDV